MLLAKLFRRRGVADAAHALYGAAVMRARAPLFYRNLGVPDTLEGRFEMICLHVFVILRRLRGGTAEGELSQAVFDLMFADMDRNLRELGVGDLGVGRRVKAMAKALYGRIAAYDSGLAAGDESLALSVQRNIYGEAGASPSTAALSLARYMRACTTVVADIPKEALARGEVAFAPLPEPEPA